MTSSREEFLRGAAEEKVFLPLCERCGTWAWPPSELCRVCGSVNWQWEPASGSGVVLSVARVWRGTGEPFGDEVPYDLVLVELAEGPEFITRAASERLAPGTPVDLVWRTVAGSPWPCAARAAFFIGSVLYSPPRRRQSEVTAGTTPRGIKSIVPISTSA